MRVAAGWAWLVAVLAVINIVLLGQIQARLLQDAGDNPRGAALHAAEGVAPARVAPAPSNAWRPGEGAPAAPGQPGAAGPASRGPGRDGVPDASGTPPSGPATPTAPEAGARGPEDTQAPVLDDFSLQDVLWGLRDALSRRALRFDPAQARRLAMFLGQRQGPWTTRRAREDRAVRQLLATLDARQRRMVSVHAAADVTWAYADLPAFQGRAPRPDEDVGVAALQSLLQGSQPLSGSEGGDLGLPDLPADASMSLLDALHGVLRLTRTQAGIRAEQKPALRDAVQVETHLLAADYRDKQQLLALLDHEQVRFVEQALRAGGDTRAVRRRVSPAEVASGL